MIYKCQDCVNRNNCPENKTQYEALSTLIEAMDKLDKTVPFHCWYSLTLKCDYFVEDTTICQQEAYSELV